ncbi:hypothetical protein C922_04849 [Plasmodium inui San Antonio 1]|uniref:Uncharacterized protein n=1 Tax=Plasmodium inui San Antonio 1 TaxID=1237626 RepID=W7A6U4_9APIC|nr:hypothetical protein C922_04849 [Plasmodium inui San Antonio 1]EUD64809.1 hypothetical protein C922_04849 [Plasmodium inui San Antonio 1]
MNDTLAWDWTPRPSRAATQGSCNPNEERFCFQINKGQRTNQRIEAGVRQWMTTQLKGGESYHHQKARYESGTKIQSKGTSVLEWEDLIDSVVHWCLRRSQDKKNDNSEEKLLGLAESRLWQSLMGARGPIRCAASADCQKMLYLIGCVLSWFLEGNRNILKQAGRGWDPCKRLRSQVENSVKTISRGEDNWTVTIKKSAECDVDGHFKDCGSQLVSLVLSVAAAVKSLCPGCPYQVLDEFFGNAFRLGPGQSLYCEAKQGVYNRCRVGNSRQGEELVLFSYDDQNTKEPKPQAQPQLGLNKDAALNELTSAPSPSSRAVPTVVQQKQEVQAPSSQAAVESPAGNDRTEEGSDGDFSLQQTPEIPSEKSIDGTNMNSLSEDTGGIGVLGGTGESQVSESLDSETHSIGSNIQQTEEELTVKDSPNTNQIEEFSETEQKGVGKILGIVIGVSLMFVTSGSLGTLGRAYQDRLNGGAEDEPEASGFLRHQERVLRTMRSSREEGRSASPPTSQGDPILGFREAAPRSGGEA